MYNAATGHDPKDDLATDYHGFLTKLGCNEMFKMKKLGINNRAPPPGASIDASGILIANSELPYTIIMHA